MAVEELYRLDYEVSNSDLVSLQVTPAVSINRDVLKRNSLPIRAFDLAFTSVGLLALSPIMVGICAAIAIDSRGGVFFRQARVGKDGKPFKVWKFRTMHAAQPGDRTFSVSGDARITRIGRILRKTKLDELPQLFNVVTGEMSLVGPRPQVPDYFELFPASSQDAITMVPPGVTGLTQLALPAEDDLLATVECPERFHREFLPRVKGQLDALYVSRRSLSLNVKILWQTFKFVAMRKRPTKLPLLEGTEFTVSEDGFTPVSLR